MHLVDVHAHLDHPDFSGDVADVLSRAKAKGVAVVIAQGINHESNQRVLALAHAHPMVKAALGLYPCEAMDVALLEGSERTTAYTVETTLKFIDAHAKEIIAIGEVGLDLQESADLAHQVDVFRKIIKLAKKHKKPLIIHSRKAEKEVLDVLEEERYTRAVMHCYTGNKAQLQRGVRMGLMFSIPPAIVRNPQFQMNVKELPLGNILTETDAPYMSPMRGIRNEPGYVRDAIVKIAEIKRMDPQEVANQVFFNYQKLFQ